MSCFATGSAGEQKDTLPRSKFDVPEASPLRNTNHGPRLAVHGSRVTTHHSPITTCSGSMVYLKTSRGTQHDRPKTAVRQRGRSAGRYTRGTHDRPGGR